MSDLLHRAFAEAAKLPEAEQDVLAQRRLERGILDGSEIYDGELAEALRTGTEKRNP